MLKCHVTLYHLSHATDVQAAPAAVKCQALAQ